MTISEELRKIVAGEVSDDEATLGKFSNDASLFEIKPKSVVYPKTKEDLQAIVRYASDKEGVSVTGRSGGTDMTGGALSESIVLDFTKYLNKIVKVDENFAVSEPGAYYRDFEKETLKLNRVMPSYPASREICAIGGIVMNNSGGERTLRYGKTAEYVEEVEMVLADGNIYRFGKLSGAELEAKIRQDDFEGEIYRNISSLIKENYDPIKNARPKVSKNSSGYYLWDVYDKENDTFNLAKLFTGSQGTLGLMSEVKFRLIEPKPYSQMVIVFLDSLEDIGELVKEVLKHEPTTFESYDDKTLKLAARFFLEFVRRLGLRNIFILAKNGVPEAVSIIRKGFPKLVLQITFRGDDKKELCKKAQKLAGDIAKFKPRYTEVIRSDIEAEEYWLVRRESFNLLRNKIHGRRTAPFVDDISLDPAVLAEFLPRLEQIFEEYRDKMIYNIAGHIGNGNFHIIPLVDFTDESARAAIPEVAKRVYDLVFEFGGSSTGEHNDGIIRTPFVRQQFGDEVHALFEETKKIFDPKNIFNPGKKVPSTRPSPSGQVPGTMEYAIEHIKQHNS